MLTYTKKEIDAAISRLTCCYGATMEAQVDARRDGCKSGQATNLALGAQEFLYLYALTKVNADESGLIGYNALTQDQIANIIEWIVQKCGCLCLSDGGSSVTPPEPVFKSVAILNQLRGGQQIGYQLIQDGNVLVDRVDVPNSGVLASVDVNIPVYLKIIDRFGFTGQLQALYFQNGTPEMTSYIGLNDGELYDLSYNLDDPNNSIKVLFVSNDYPFRVFHASFDTNLDEPIQISGEVNLSLQPDNELLFDCKAPAFVPGEENISIFQEGSNSIRYRQYFMGLPPADFDQVLSAPGGSTAPFNLPDIDYGGNRVYSFNKNS